MKAPWRNVVRAALHGGGSINRPFKYHWWVLGLDCGHEVERRVKWLPPPDGSRPARGFAAQHHGVSLTRTPPAPTRARCEECASIGSQELRVRDQFAGIHEMLRPGATFMETPPETPLTMADLAAVVRKLAQPPLPPEATPEERALRRMLDDGKARLSPRTLHDLRTAVKPPAWDHATPSKPDRPVLGMLGALNLVIEPGLPDGYLFAVTPPEDPPDDKLDWKVRWWLIRDIGNL